WLECKAKISGCLMRVRERHTIEEKCLHPAPLPFRDLCVCVCGCVFGCLCTHSLFCSLCYATSSPTTPSRRQEREGGKCLCVCVCVCVALIVCCFIVYIS